MPDMPPLSAQLVTRDQIARIDKGKDYGSCAGQLTLDATVGTHVLDATGPLALTLPAKVADWAFFTVLCASGGTNVTVTGVDAWPLGEPGAADVFVWNFQRVRGQWFGFAAGAGVAATPDTTPPSQPGLKATTVTDTSVTLTVTRGIDDESKPTLKARYYAQGAASKPDFAPVTLTGGAWLVEGLTQNSAYVFEVQEVSKGGISATTSTTVTTAKTKGWVVASSATFNAPDGTDPGTLTMSDGQAIVKKDTSGGETLQITNNAATMAMLHEGNGTAMLVLPASSILKMGRARAQYRFLPGSGSSTALDLMVTGGYPLGSIILTISADGSLKLDTSGSNTSWTTPVWTGPQTGYPTSGTISLSVDADNKTVWVWANGQQIASTTAQEALPGMASARLRYGLWAGGGIAVDEVDILTYQN